MKTMKPKISNCKGKASFVDTSRGLRSVDVNAPFLKPCPVSFHVFSEVLSGIFCTSKLRRTQTSTGDIRKCSVYSIKDI